MATTMARILTAATIPWTHTSIAGTGRKRMITMIHVPLTQMLTMGIARGRDAFNLEGHNIAGRTLLPIVVPEEIILTV